MSDFDQRQLLANAVPLIAVVLMASGVVVRTLPLESKRPVESDVAKIAHAGRQDVDARLWQDPFVVMRDVQGTTPAARCREAMGDVAHHPSTLTASVLNVQTRRAHAVTVMPVFVPGGPYSQDSESRRRTRYATVMALLQTGWVPGDEEKLGFVWTFENCVDRPWARSIPELLPYEWFRKEKNGESLLILWIDEDVISRRPLRGMATLTALLQRGRNACPPEAQAGNRDDYDQSIGLRRVLAKAVEVAKAGDGVKLCRDESTGGATQTPVQWHRTVVLGPWTSTALFGLVDELAREPKGDEGDACMEATSPEGACNGSPRLRFYSSTATARIDEDAFLDALRACRKRNKDESGCEADVESIEEKFHERVVRLNATDDRLTRDLVDELTLRLAAATPLKPGHQALCEGTIVIVAEGDTRYARAFSNEFDRRLGDEVCGNGRRPAVEQVGYLRGLDGIAPGPGGTQARAATTQPSQRPSAQDLLLEQAAMERADGPSQFDYLRRLAARLVDLDRSERAAGRHGVAAIGVLGNDAYDKILVLDALRDRFPKAVFFAADLDARLLGGGSVRSTRNLVVASGYGLSLQPGLQGSAPPFRDTYQTGTYLSTLVALDATASRLGTGDFESWFGNSRMYEIGRTRAVNLVGGRTAPRAPEPCRAPDPGQCTFIHDDADWRSFDPLPGARASIALLFMVLASTGLAFMLSRRARRVMRGAWSRATPASVGVVAFAVALVGTGLYAIHRIVRLPDGEPFAWLEGVSIWPTQIIGMVILVVTVALLVYGRLRLRSNIDEVARTFGLVTLRECEQASSPQGRRGLRRRSEWLWGLDADEAPPGAGSVADAWSEFVDRMRLRPSAARISLATLLFLVFGIAFISFDWPNSPHRGLAAAWFNHGLQFVLIGAVMALLFAALDASAVATRFLSRIQRVAPGSESLGPVLQGGATGYPVSDRARGLWTRFRLAVEVASAVNRLVYLPFIVLLLLVPARSRVFDAWDFSLPYAALLVISLALAARCAMGLRRQAGKLRANVLAELDGEADRREIEAKLGAAASGPEGAVRGARPQGDPSDVPPALQAELLRRMTNEIRAVRDGPFRPLSQEPVVRGILLVLGGTGGITTAEFLFLSRG